MTGAATCTDSGDDLVEAVDVCAAKEGGRVRSVQMK
jgi:hypothetical protein